MQIASRTVCLPPLAGDKAFEVAGGKWVACSDVLLRVIVPAVAGKIAAFRLYRPSSIGAARVLSRRRQLPARA